MNFFSKIFGKKSTAGLNLEKTQDGQWMVTKKFRILYMGTKESCQNFIEKQLQTEWQHAS